MSNRGERLVFVTVGTTKFDSLIKTATSKSCCQLLKSLGYNKLVLQIGNGDYEPDALENEDFSVKCFHLKNSIQDDIQSADLVISHAGAGSILDALGAGKHLVVVINEELMGNHQTELASQLANDGHLYFCTCSTLENTLKTADFSILKPYAPGKPEKFASFLDQVMGYA
ncbi:UDP-N-acetylglucosamine transferase subunit ALG13 homolog [Gigantopelta aegis]|uniref:UDP-N-acetylglucosamine transferase subunit ALG13 homolog n=1 Tax=Gigantopelta aegis TaxID=1735272 RepID=UPI001B887FF4|nr:UDP-N-acetylglucosamine transferase subunit ALG13 homolog [Gigantopelta aegis]